MIELIIYLVIVGILLYCINRYVPMDGKVKFLLNAVVIIALVCMVLRDFGVFSYMSRHDSKPLPQAGHGCSIGMVGR